jgi:hypothetical protein
LVDLEGFGEESVRARLFGELQSPFDTRKIDDRDMLDEGIRFDEGSGLDAVGIGHSVVHEDEVGHKIFDHFYQYIGTPKYQHVVSPVGQDELANGQMIHIVVYQ